MKQVIGGGLLAAITFIVIAAMMVVSGRNIRKNELEKSLEHAVEQAVKHFAGKENKKVSREECLEILKQNLLLGIESDSEILVSIMAVDTEKGILSVEAEENFRNPLGKAETLKAVKTIVLESYRLKEKNVYTITYKVGNEIYKQYAFKEGSRLLVPAEPEGNFVQWMDESGQAVELEGIVVDSDKVFVAQMNP